MRDFAVGKSHFASSGGSRIHYLRYDAGSTRKPGLLFVHGMWAHAHWWDHIAPCFLDRFTVLAIDLSGMGDSERRSAYSAEVFAQDIVAVLEDAGLSSTIVVAHSFGGTPGVFACDRRPDLIARLVILDSCLNLPTRPLPEPDHCAQLASKRIYADPAQAIDRYRLIPPGGPVSRDIVAHIATSGLRKEDNGWVWKFDLAVDPQLFHHRSGWIPAVTGTPVDYIFGESSRSVSRDVAAAIADYLPTCGEPVGIPGAGHHIMLEQPDMLVAVLRALWSRFA